MKTTSTILTIRIQNVETRYIYLKQDSCAPTSEKCWSCNADAKLSLCASLLLVHKLILPLSPSSRTLLSAWPIWVQHATSIHFCKCGSKTWSCAAASMSATTPERRNTTQILVCHSNTCVFQAFIELGFPLSCFLLFYFQSTSPSPSASICSICLRSCRTATGSTSTPRAWSKLLAWTPASSRYTTTLNWWTTIQ